MNTGSRLPGLVLLSVVIVAAVLLISGLGVSVGIGLLVGVALGLLAVVTFMALSQRRRSSVSWLSADSGSTGPDRAAVERHGRDFMRVAGVESSALRRVLAIGRQVEAGGVRVELIAIELRDDGGLALVVANSHPPIGPAAHFATAHISDDAGTNYVAAGQGAGGSTPLTTRYEVHFAPTPPASARVLTLTIERFADPFQGSGIARDGPWSFEIDLARPGGDGD